MSTDAAQLHQEFISTGTYELLATSMMQHVLTKPPIMTIFNSNNIKVITARPYYPIALKVTGNKESYCVGIRVLKIDLACTVYRCW